MRRFLNPERLWTAADGPDEDRIKPHVLWLPHNQPQVLAYLARFREVLARYQDFITPVAEPDLHMTIQKIDSHDRDGRRIDKGRRPGPGRPQIYQRPSGPGAFGLGLIPGRPTLLGLSRRYALRHWRGGEE